MKTLRNLTGLVAFTMASTGVLCAQSFPIHADCVNNQHPVLCTEMVNQLITELGAFNAVFQNPNAAQAAAFYHPLATLYTAATGQFYVGRESIQNDYFVPFIAVIRSASVNFQPFHYSVIDFNTIVAYGRLPATGVFKDGTPLVQPPLPQTLTFIRNPNFDPKKPFLITSDQE